MLYLNYESLKTATDATLREVQRRYATAEKGSDQYHAYEMARGLLLEREGIRQQIFTPATQRWKSIKFY